MRGGVVFLSAFALAIAAVIAQTTSYQQVSVNVPARVVPGGSFNVAVVLQNNGGSAWGYSSSNLAYSGDAGMVGTTLRTSSNVQPGQSGLFEATVSAPTQVGVFSLKWNVILNGATYGTVSAKIEVTCDDGIFCNGDEHYVKGKCVQNAVSPCDDGQACTQDICVEATRSCNHVLSAGCASCAAKNCNPKCRGKVCGDDGCGGSCGTCVSPLACITGQCVVANTPGTCLNPLPLFQSGTTVQFGRFSVSGDTSTATNVLFPACNVVSTAPELVYRFDITPEQGPVGVDIRMSGYDTVLDLRMGTASDCIDVTKSVKCSDDASPPGNFGSRIAGMLQPGTYYLICDGFSGSQKGSFTLDLTFAQNCEPQCDGRFCGDNGCGGSCGPVCDAGYACNMFGRCIPDPCIPRCNGRKCGDDGCGGSCGTCGQGDICVDSVGVCKAFWQCDHMKPTCPQPCATNEYCGTDCACHKVNSKKPDLIVAEQRLRDEIVFERREFRDGSCAIVEGCVAGPGSRRLLKFTVEAANQGLAAFEPPAPKTRPDLFQFSPCHNHWHFLGFALYELVDMQGNVILTGRKQAYCMEDTVQYFSSPSVPCNTKYSCDNQGVQPGWSDIYSNDLDCQWLDITDITPGTYKLRVAVNPSRFFDEVTFDNNVTEVTVEIPAEN